MDKPITVEWVIKRLQELEPSTFFGTISKRYREGESYIVEVTITLKP